MEHFRRFLGCGPDWFCARADQVHEEPAVEPEALGGWLCCCEASVPRVVRYDEPDGADSVSLLEVPAELERLANGKNLDMIFPTDSSCLEEELSRCAEWDKLRNFHIGLSRERGSLPRSASLITSDCCSNRSDHDGSSYSSLFQRRPSFLDSTPMKHHSKEVFLSILQRKELRVSQETHSTAGSTRSTSD